LGKKLAPGGGQRGEIEAGQRRGVQVVGPQVAVVDRLDERAEAARVAGGDQVDRAAHQRDPHHLAVAQQPAQLLGVECGQSRPQPHVRRVRRLPLEADEVLHGLGHAQRRALQQVLAGERGAPEGAPRQGCRHRSPSKKARTSPTSVSVARWAA
jgi:hypothetical protein